MKQLVIVSSKSDSPGALELQAAAKKLHWKASIILLGDENIIDKIQFADYIIYRIKPETYNVYQSIRERLDDDHQQLLDGVLDAFDKAKTQIVLENNNIPTPRGTLMAHGTQPIHYPTVIKVLRGNQGKGVALLKNEADYYRFIIEYPEDHYLLQEFIKEADAQDKRLIIVKGRCIAAMRRQSTTKDFRANLHQGGVAESYAPSQEETDLAIRATQSFGLDFAGVDIIDAISGPLVLEVNPSPGLGISKIIGINVADATMKVLLHD